MSSVWPRISSMKLLSEHRRLSTAFCPAAILYSSFRSAAEFRLNFAALAFAHGARSRNLPGGSSTRSSAAAESRSTVCSMDVGVWKISSWSAFCESRRPNSLNERRDIPQAHSIPRRRLRDDHLPRGVAFTSCSTWPVHYRFAEVLVFIRSGCRINFCTRQLLRSATYSSFSDGHAMP